MAGGLPGGGLGLLMANVPGTRAGFAMFEALLAGAGRRGLCKAKGFSPAGGGRTGGAILWTGCAVSGAARGWRSPAKTCQSIADQIIFLQIL